MPGRMSPAATWRSSRWGGWELTRGEFKVFKVRRMGLTSSNLEVFKVGGMGASPAATLRSSRCRGELKVFKVGRMGLTNNELKIFKVGGMGGESPGATLRLSRGVEWGVSSSNLEVFKVGGMGADQVQTQGIQGGWDGGMTSSNFEVFRVGGMWELGRWGERDQASLKPPCSWSQGPHTHPLPTPAPPRPGQRRVGDMRGALRTRLSGRPTSAVP